MPEPKVGRAVLNQIDSDFSQDFDIYTILTNDLRLATLHDLQTKYNTEDAYDLIEIIEVRSAIDGVVQKQRELEEKLSK